MALWFFKHAFHLSRVRAGIWDAETGALAKARQDTKCGGAAMRLKMPKVLSLEREIRPISRHLSGVVIFSITA